MVRLSRKLPDRGDGTRRAGRREAVLGEAARQINERGAAAVNLNDIAAAVGLTRNALYYYVSDRWDLVFQSYMRSCTTTAADLELAIRTGGSPTRQLATFIETAVRYAGNPPAVLSDLDCLPEPQRATIADLNERNITTLTRLIACEVEAGRYRAIDPDIAAQCLNGMIAWTKLSAIWLGLDDSDSARARRANTICELILNGMAARAEKRFDCAIDASKLLVRTFNAFDRAEVGQEKVTQLVQAASRLFNRRGCDGVSLDDISASVGATKGAVYHYFNDKTDLIARCYEHAFDDFTCFVESARAAPGSGLEKALRVVHLNCQAQAGPAPPLMPQPGLFALSPETSTHLVDRAQAVWTSCQDLVNDGIADGSVRPLPASDVAMVAAGAFLWIPKWINGGAPDPVRIADEICALLMDGLVNDRPDG